MKKGQVGRSLGFIFLFLVFGVIAIGTLISVKSIVGKEYSLRESFSDILAYKLATCINENPSIDIDNLFDRCGIEKNVVNKDFIYEIKIKDKTLKKGTIEYCDINPELKEKNPSIPICKTVYGDDFVIIVGTNKKVEVSK